MLFKGEGDRKISHTWWNFSRKWQLSLFGHDLILTSPVEMVLNYKVPEKASEREVSRWRQFYQHVFFLCSFLLRPFRSEEHLAERVHSVGGPIRAKAVRRRRPPLRDKPLLCWLNFPGCSSVSVTPCQLPTTLSTTCCLLSTNCL